MGYGAPRASQRNPNLPPVGTQGQFWMVFFSHGFPGAFFFVGFAFVATWRTRRARTNPALWCHISLLLGIVMMPFYGWLHMEIHIIAVAFALACREMIDPDEPAPPLAPPTWRIDVMRASLPERRVSAPTPAHGSADAPGPSSAASSLRDHSSGRSVSTGSRPSRTRVR
jgi:hypothetical protein